MNQGPGNTYPPQGQQGYPPQGQGQGNPQQGQQGYPPQGQPGYPPQQGYPPQGQQGYPPQGKQGYPPQGQGHAPQGQGHPLQGQAPMRQQMGPSMEEIANARHNLKETQLRTSVHGGLHSYSKEEVRVLGDYINTVLGNDETLLSMGLLPLDLSDPSNFFRACENGVILSKLINFTKEGMINPNHITTDPSMSLFHKNQNLDTALRAASEMGLTVVNAGAEDFLKHNEHIVLGVMWQIVVFKLLSHINPHEHPELVQLMGSGEQLHSFFNLPKEETILRWINYHLERAGSNRRVRNFSTDLRDGENYITLLSQIAPSHFPPESINEQDPKVRADIVVDVATKNGIQPFVTPADILNGKEKNNLAFCADMFNKYSTIQNDRYNDEQQRALDEANRLYQQKLEKEENERNERWRREEEERQRRWAQEDAERQQRILHEQTMHNQNLQTQQMEMDRKLAEEKRRFNLILNNFRLEEDKRRFEESKRQQEEDLRYTEQKMQTNQTQNSMYSQTNNQNIPPNMNTTNNYYSSYTSQNNYSYQSNPYPVNPVPSNPVPGNSPHPDPVMTNPYPVNPVPGNPVPGNPVPGNPVPYGNYMSTNTMSTSFLQ
eukprot:TRINITY_DN340_c0_g1_i10.p1 TRINITY_DN340_c0_g1~~TRINITY_DN340_c0_g1_i10.p1  ORF type:complete len:610 (-),score=143.82 TRINITY_DN340_c0_g1_i10:207-2015(-)